MSADLQFWHPSHLNDPIGTLRPRVVNTVSQPVVTAAVLDNGQATPGVWELTFVRSGASVTAEVRSLLDSAVKSYWHNPAGVGVVADGVTLNTQVVGGIGLVISAAVDTGHKARVAIGNFLEENGSYTLMLSSDIVRAGTTSAPVRIAVKNVGDCPAAECMVYAIPGVFGFGTGWDTLIKTLREHPSTARHKLARGIPGDHVITFGDWKTAGDGKRTADVYVNYAKTIEDARFDGVTQYHYGAGNGYIDTVDKFTGLSITFADTNENPTSATLTMRVTPPDDRWVEFAPDMSGSPGTFASQDLTLTEAGKPAGTITPGGAAFFWLRWAVPLGALAAPERHVMPVVIGLSI